MKKFLALLFLCSLCVSALPGCGGGGENEVAEVTDEAAAASAEYDKQMAEFGGYNGK